MLFRNIQQRKQKLANDTEITESITAYSHSRSESSQDDRFQIFQPSQNISQNVQISSRQLFRDFHYSQISSSQTSNIQSMQISHYLSNNSSYESMNNESMNQSSMNFTNQNFSNQNFSNQIQSSQSSIPQTSQSSSSLSQTLSDVSSGNIISYEQNDFFRQLALLNKIYKEKNKFSDIDSNFDMKVMIFYDKYRRARLSS